MSEVKKLIENNGKKGKQFRTTISVTESDYKIFEIHCKCLGLTTGLMMDSMIRDFNATYIRIGLDELDLREPDGKAKKT